MKGQQRRQLLVDRGSRRAGTELGVNTRALGRPISFNGEDRKWRDWSVVFRSPAELVNTSLTKLLPDAEAADLVALAKRNNTCSVPGPLHLLLHLTTGRALDKVATSGDREGLNAWHSL